MAQVCTGGTGAPSQLRRWQASGLQCHATTTQPQSTQNTSALANDSHQSYAAHSAHTGRAPHGHTTIIDSKGVISLSNSTSQLQCVCYQHRPLGRAMLPQYRVHSSPYSLPRNNHPQATSCWCACQTAMPPRADMLHPNIREPQFRIDARHEGGHTCYCGGRQLWQSFVPPLYLMHRLGMTTVRWQQYREMLLLN
jgi:hypothetical protein